MKDGKINGWDFIRAYSADGTSTLDLLKSERSKLGIRLNKIPVEIATLTNRNKLRNEDIKWLGSISKRKLKKWEKEKGRIAKDQIYKAKNAIITDKGKITALLSEQKRIPSQISSITKQITTLINGESTGLEKGLDKETAKELGEIELEKERDRLEHERNLQEIELEKEKVSAETIAKKQIKDSENKNKWLIGISLAILLALVAWFIYKKRIAKKLVAV